jgi:hypothetical protein
MKTSKSIFIAIAFLLCFSGVMAQEQSDLYLTDASPHQGQYRAVIEVWYDGAFESITQSCNVTLNAHNYIPFSIDNDVDDNLYQIKVYILEPVTGWQGPYPSSAFNTYFWRNTNVPVTASL